MSRKSSTKNNSTLEPLTGRNAEGYDYERSSEVERQILACLSLSDIEIVANAKIENKEGSGYLQEEALVYLIKKCHKEQNSVLYNDLAQILIDRCHKRLIYRHRSIDSEGKDDAYANVILNLFEEICAKDKKGDFLQVRFWVTFDRMAIDVFRTYSRKQSKDRANLHPDSFIGADETGESEDLWATAVLRIDQNIPDNRRGSSAEMEGLKKDAYQVLKEPIRTIFLLHHYEGWPIGSIDPDEWTLSKQYKVSEKTIGNWLRKAEKDLQEWRGDHHE